MDEKKPYPESLREDEDYGIQLLYAPPEFWEEERKKRKPRGKQPPIQAVYAAPELPKDR